MDYGYGVWIAAHGALPLAVLSYEEMREDGWLGVGGHQANAGKSQGQVR